MWPNRRLIELLQIEHPLVLAPMAGIGTVELAASVCAAGGLGSIGCAAMQPELVAKTVQALRGLTDKPINVNFFCLPDFPLPMGELAPLRTIAEQKGNSDFTPFWSGQAAPLGREMPAEALTLRLVEEAIERFKQLNPN